MTVMLESENILQLLRVPDTNTYVLGCFGSRLTFSSQQCRAFNLIWALLDRGHLTGGDQLAVVGAGLAGITVAAAATVLGVKVTIFEQANQSMAAQRGNFVRYIHPNILDWPQENSDSATTDWDILNWDAAPLDNVVSQINQGWANFENAVTTHFRYRVDEVDLRTNQVRATALEPELSPIEKNFDAIVLAVGFGAERNLENIPLRSYWLNDDLHQESKASVARRRLLVTGCGDGGLIDVLRLRFTNFDHATFVKDVLNDEELRSVRDRLITIELEAREKPTKKGSNAYLVNAYRELPFPDNVIDRFRRWLRLDTDVILNGPDDTPVTIQASILHRYIVFLLWSYKLLTYRQGKIVHVSGNRGNYSVTFENSDGTKVISTFDDVIVRHGPEPVVQKLIPESEVQELCRLWHAATTDPTITKHWPPGFFRPMPSLKKKSDPDQEAKTSLNKALAALRMIHIVSIRVGMVGKRVGYVVMPTNLEHQDKWPKTVLGFPVEYQIEKRLPRPKDVQSPAMLQPGAMIYCEESRGSSTLGCFVLTKQREIGFITTSHGFLPRGEPIGSKVYQTTDLRVRDSRQSVATVRAFMEPIPSPPNSDPQRTALNSFDIAVCVLSPDVPYNTRFDKNWGLPPLVGTAWPRRGDRVFKVGARTGLTYGTIVSISAIMFLKAQGNPLWLQNAFTIEPEGTSMFSHQGDSGSLVVRHSDSGGLVLGMLVGSDQRRLSYALPLQPALEALDCSMILQNTFLQDWKRLCHS